MFIQLCPLQCVVEDLTGTSASQPKLDVITIVGHGVLDDASQKLVLTEQEKTYPNDSQEDAGRTKNNLSRWNDTGVFQNA